MPDAPKGSSHQYLLRPGRPVYVDIGAMLSRFEPASGLNLPLSKFPMIRIGRQLLLRDEKNNAASPKGASCGVETGARKCAKGPRIPRGRSQAPSDKLSCYIRLESGHHLEVNLSQPCYTVAMQHSVTQGECISSIAFDNGLFWETVWNHPENQALKDQRKDPNILLPGDVVFIPDKRIKEADLALTATHTFRMKGVPAKLNLRLMLDGQPRANQPYTFYLNGQVSTGLTDADGYVKRSIPPNALEAQLVIGEGDDKMEYDLALGHLNPADALSGVQSRLRNLGFYAGPIDGSMSEATKLAIEAFQASAGLEITGAADGPTQDKLRNSHEGQ
jgi:hypothetical protein